MGTPEKQPDTGTQYIVKVRIRTGMEKGTKKPVFAMPGTAITLSDAAAAPLLACKAIRKPDIAPAPEAE